MLVFRGVSGDETPETRDTLDPQSTPRNRLKLLVVLGVFAAWQSNWKFTSATRSPSTPKKKGKALI